MDQLYGDLPDVCRGISPIDMESGESSGKFRYDTGAPVGDCELIVLLNYYHVLLNKLILRQSPIS